MKIQHKFFMRFLATVVFTLLSTVGFSQTKGWNIDMGTGYRAGYFHDKTLSPLNYIKSDFATTISAGYSWQCGSVIEFGFGGAIGQISAPSRYTATDNYNFNLFANYLVKVGNWNNFTMLAGGGYQMRIDFSLRTLSLYSYIASHSLRPIIQGNWNFNRNNISTRLDFHLLGFVSRPPYSRLPNYDDQPHDYCEYILGEFFSGDFATIGQFWDLNLGVEYCYALSNVVAVGVSYELRTTQYLKPSAVSIIDNTLMAKVRFRL